MKRCLSIILVLFFLWGFSAKNEAATESIWENVTALTDGTYVMVMPRITPTGMAAGDYFMKTAQASNPGFQFGPFVSGQTVPVWEIRLEGKGCIIRAADIPGPNNYVNLSASSLTLGAKQVLDVTVDAGKFMFSVTSGGKVYYIRFTNQQNEPRFTTGTGTASHRFDLYRVSERDVVSLPPVSGDPLLKVSCIADLHVDYGIQSQTNPIRSGTVAACEAIGRQESPDVLLVGGDMTSDNGKQTWNLSLFRNAQDAIAAAARRAVPSGRVLYAAGNHDYQAGDGKGFDSNDYSQIMLRDTGNFVSTWRQREDGGTSSYLYPDYLLAYHYRIEGYDFIVINAPYKQALTYSEGTLQWLEKELQSIGRMKTVFLMTHYPLSDSRNISTYSYGLTGAVYDRLTGILLNYPNLIYLYGHNHGQAESVYIHNDTFERITPYDRDGTVLSSPRVLPESFVSSFMGSMAYYKVSFYPDWLGSTQPAVVQALTVSVYEDRIVFKMKNYGTVHGGTLQPAAYELPREVVYGQSCPEGDVNGDGRVSAVDALFALQAEQGQRTLTRMQTISADVNADFVIQTSDAVVLLAVSIGK